MENKYTLIASVNMSGNTIKVGEEIPNLNFLQVAKLLKQGVAHFKTKKEEKEFKDIYEAEEKKAQEVKAKEAAEAKRKVLTDELSLIYTDAVKKEAEIKGIVMEDAQILANVEALLNRVKGA